MALGKLFIWGKKLSPCLISYKEIHSMRIKEANINKKGKPLKKKKTSKNI